MTIAATQKRNLPNRPGRSSGSALADEVRSALGWLKRHATKRTRDGMARYAIPSDNALGVTMSDLKVLAKRLGRDHELAAALWETGLSFSGPIVEDRLFFFINGEVERTQDPGSNFIASRGGASGFGISRVDAATMDAIVHDKGADDAQFIQGLRFIERAADDERHFVKKGVNMALRAVGKRNPALNAAAVTVARRLAESPDAAPRWIGKDALRELTSSAVTRRLAARG